MRDSVIANALCFLDGVKNAPHVTAEGLSLRDVYLRNSYVSLWSARKHHPECDAVLVTNIPLDAPYEALFAGAGIGVNLVPFDRYLLPPNYPWRLAYYKLRATESLVEQYSQILLVDADAVVVARFEDLWNESERRVFLFDTSHRYEHPYRSDIRQVGQSLFDTELNPLHLGGEALCGSSTLLGHYLQLCAQVFQRMTEDPSTYPPEKDQGDETVWSIAAALLEREGGLSVRPLNPYLFRYWTGKSFNLMSNNYKWNPVSIWHLPLEKESGILTLFDFIVESGTMPSGKKLYFMLHLEKPKWRMMGDWALAALRRLGLWKR